MLGHDAIEICKLYIGRLNDERVDVICLSDLSMLNTSTAAFLLSQPVTDICTVATIAASGQLLVIQ